MGENVSTKIRRHQLARLGVAAVSAGLALSVPVAPVLSSVTADGSVAVAPRSGALSVALDGTQAELGTFH